VWQFLSQADTAPVKEWIMAVSEVELQHYLQGVKYPSRKEELIRKARENQAPRDVIDLIHNLPDREFNSTADVSRAVVEIG
jgi:coproporphyrinogen III oxidase-like Fe-S oxidoreductase